VTTRRQTRDDVRENQEAHALTNTSLGNQLGQPHNERGTRSHDGDHKQREPERELRNQVNIEAEQRLVVIVERVDQTR
jgi:hypothetical protein